MVKTKLQLAEEIHDYDLKELVLAEIREVFNMHKAKSMPRGSQEALLYLGNVQKQQAVQNEQKLAIAADNEMIAKYKHEEEKSNKS